MLLLLFLAVFVLLPLLGVLENLVHSISRFPQQLPKLPLSTMLPWLVQAETAERRPRSKPGDDLLPLARLKVVTTAVSTDLKHSGGRRSEEEQASCPAPGALEDAAIGWVGPAEVVVVDGVLAGVVVTDTSLAARLCVGLARRIGWVLAGSGGLV